MQTIYQSDLLITGSNEIELKRFKANIMNEFEMVDPGNLAYFLRMEFINIRSGVSQIKKNMHEIRNSQ